MLRTLSIRDFVIVDSIELEFAAGFTVFTGETGAGKSILIDALALVLGGRGEASMVREGAQKADISAEFVAHHEALTAWLTNQALQSDEGVVLLRRVIDLAGRSKAYINGIAATATQLREVGEMLVDIHGQHAHQLLLKTSAQRSLLDNQANLQEMVNTVAQHYQTWRALVKQREAFENNAKQVLQERERLEWQVGELDKLALKVGEWEQLNHEHSRLSHAASLIDGTQAALMVLAESDQSILTQLSHLNQKIAKLADIDDALRVVLEQTEPARIQVQEAVYAIKDYLDRIELDPDRLRAVEMRIEILYAAARKFHVTPEDLLNEHAALSTQLQQLGQASDVEGLRQQEEQAQAQYQQVARQLSQARSKAAAWLGEQVTKAMQELNMSGGRFVVDLLPCAPASYGLEDVELLVAGHAGTAPRPLAKIASGGELARISLALAVITASSTATPTLIFDEVDSGIGGAVAEVVGRLLKRLGNMHQVLCITHLPQVASQATQHFQVSKATQNNTTANMRPTTLASITALTPADRIEEIARMLGGVEITVTTRTHARELLSL